MTDQIYDNYPIKIGSVQIGELRVVKGMTAEDIQFLFLKLVDIKNQILAANNQKNIVPRNI